MKKYLVLYYSNTGNSKFLAEKIARELGCDLRKVTPIINNTLLLYLLSLLKFRVTVDFSQKDIEKYDEVIIIGPIWGGLLVSPLMSTIKKCVKASKNIHFTVSCESGDTEKNDKYGYAQVLKAAENMGGGFVKTTEAFSMKLINKDTQKQPPKLLEKIKITEESFEGKIKERFDNFIAKIKFNLSLTA